MRERMISLFLAASVCVGCGGGASAGNPSPTPTPPTPSLQGPWEIATVSTANPGFNTFIEVNLQSNGSSFSSYQLVEVITKTASLGSPPVGSLLYNGTCYSLNNSCANSAGGTVTGTVATSSVSYVYQVLPGILFNGQGTYNGTTVTGTYQSQTTNSACIDSGTFTAYPVSQPTGTYTGTLLFPDKNVDNVTMTLSGACNISVTTGDMCPVTASGTISGSDSGALSLTGRTIGNFISIGGSGQTVLGSPVSYYCLRLSTVSAEPIMFEDVWASSNYLAGVLTEQ